MADTLIGEKLEQAGFKASPRPKHRFSHARTKTQTTMSWAHPDLGEFVIATDRHNIGKVNETDGYSWALVGLRSKMPKEVRVTFAANLNDDVCCVLQARGNSVIDCSGKIPDLVVKMNWDNNGPRTRQKDKDNLDHFICTEESVVMQLQTSLVSRGDATYMVNHELWCLQVVQTTEENPDYKTYLASDGKHYAAVNLWDSQAYPGADWLLTNAQVGPQVIEAMLAMDIVPPTVDVLPRMDWDPPQFPEPDKGSTGAIVLWFNPNVGAKVLCEDGESRFVPLKGIRDKEGRNTLKRGEFGIVTPKQQVLLSVEMLNTGGAFNAIKPV